MKKLTDELVEKETISNEEFVSIYNSFNGKDLGLDLKDANTQKL